MATIRCGHCGGTHESAAEVRACHQTGAVGADGTLSLFAPEMAPDALTNAAAPAEVDLREGVAAAVGDGQARHSGGPAIAGGSGDHGGGSGVSTSEGDRPPPDSYVDYGDYEDYGDGDEYDDAPIVDDRTPDQMISAMPTQRRRPRAVAARAGQLAPIEVLAGPNELGRWVLVNPGESAPPRWGDAPRIAVDGADGDAVEELHRAWLQRQRLIVEVHEWPEPDVIDTAEDPLHTLDPGFDLVSDRIRFLLRNNAVDLRNPDQPRFWPAELAITNGASVGVATDIRLADGTPAWADGGPLQFSIVEPINADGAELLSWVGLERGLLRPLRTQATTADLAPDQLAAVNHDVGGARVVAPAGSGKTRVLTERARHLIRDCGVPAEAICLVAFNKRAAVEMEERTTDLAGLQIRTLNALGLAICRGTAPFAQHPAGAKASMLTERDMRSMLDGMVNVRRRANTDPMAAWLDALSQTRLGMRDPNEVEAALAPDVTGFGEIFWDIRASFARGNALDFDEQIVHAAELLLENPDLRESAQRACRILLVDEFQDLTPAHLLLIRLLGAPGFDIFGVGDDDQTIYGYTGATPRWLLDYHHYVPGATNHALEVNYRCAPAVVAGADSLLSHNRARVDKSIRPAPGRSGEASDLSALKVPDTTAATVERIVELVGGGVDPGDVAVLTRVNATLAAVQVALGDAQVPVVKTVDANLLSRTGMRASLCWLRIAVGPDRLGASDLSEAARRPSRSLSGRVVSWIAEQKSVNDIRRLGARLKDRDGEKVTDFANDVAHLRERAKGADTATVLTAIRDEVGLSSALDSLDGSKPSVAGSTHGDDLEALISLARLQPDPASFEPWLRDHLQSPGAPAGKGVMLATIHRVKGLEWPHVVVHEASAGLMPHRLSTDVEEERRVFHVAITRSKQTTTVVAPSQGSSPFLNELTERRDPNAPEPAPVGSAGKQRPTARGGAPRAQAAPGSEGSSAGGAASGVAGVDPDLREAIRQWRLAESTERGVPAFHLFGNKTLDEIAARAPKDRAALLKCKGIGHKKLEDFGDAVLKVIAKHG